MLKIPRLASRILAGNSQRWNHRMLWTDSESSRMTVGQLISLYEQKGKSIHEGPIHMDRNKQHAVFANNEISFRYIEVYGFDYDYTLANYSDDLHKITYKLAMNQLIAHYGYPERLRSFNYDPAFPIRGLHFDARKGYLMKLDSFSHVQFGTVYKGWCQVSDVDIIKEYSGTLINVDKISKGTKRNGNTIHQQMDLFSIPFLSLLSNTIQFFMENNIHFDSEYIYHDVSKATQDVHISGLLHNTILEDLDRYLPTNNLLQTYLERLVKAGKRLFIITNSSFNFVDKGMAHLLGTGWRDMFDVVVVKARKPKFFVNTESSFRPFRNINTVTGHYQWDQVDKFQKHGVYAEGNAKLFSKFTEYDGPRVMYFGDHVYSDLMDPVLRYGWRTGAIIPELEREIEISNSEQYVRDVRWLLALEELITLAQGFDNREFQQLAQDWKQERKSLRKSMKAVFNPYFGSMFRTYHNPTSFSRRMTRYADLYTSSLLNFLKYDEEYHFFPRRISLPHEQDYSSVI